MRIIKTTHPKSKQTHRCDLCGCDINRGERYECTTLVSKSGIVTRRYHEMCCGLTKRLNLTNVHTTTSYYFNKSVARTLEGLLMQSKRKDDIPKVKTATPRVKAEITFDIFRVYEQNIAKKPTPEQEVNVNKMVDALFCVSLINRYYIDLMSEVEADGKMRHSVKRDLLRVEKLIVDEDNRAFQVFNAQENELARGFVYNCDLIDEKIGQNIALQGMERHTTIISSLLDIIDGKLSGNPITCNFEDILRIRGVLSNHFEMRGNKAIRFIIESALRDRLIKAE